MVVLALVTIGAIAAGLIYWYTQQKTSTTAGTGQVPVVSAPANPAKAQPDGDTNQSASAPAQGKKLIYDRILGSGTTSEPERIVPRQETPQAPDSNTGDDNLLPLPLPPPPQIQGSLTPGNTGPDPAQQTASAARDNLEYQGAAGSEPAASAVSTPQPTPQVDQGSINRPPVPRRKPRNLVASVQQAPTTQFQPVLQPAPAPAPALTAEQQLNAPIDLQQQAAIINPQTQAPANNQFAAPAPQLPQTRTVARDDDPLSGLRAPLNSPGQSAQQAPQALQQQRTAVVAPQPFAGTCAATAGHIAITAVIFATAGEPEPGCQSSRGIGVCRAAGGLQVRTGSTGPVSATALQARQHHRRSATVGTTDQPWRQRYLLPSGNGTAGVKASGNRVVQQAHLGRRARLPGPPPLAASRCIENQEIGGERDRHIVVYQRLPLSTHILVNIIKSMR